MDGVNSATYQSNDDLVNSSISSSTTTPPVEVLNEETTTTQTAAPQDLGISGNEGAGAAKKKKKKQSKKTFSHFVPESVPATSGNTAAELSSTVPPPGAVLDVVTTSPDPLDLDFERLIGVRKPMFIDVDLVPSSAPVSPQRTAPRDSTSVPANTSEASASRPVRQKRAAFKEIPKASKHSKNSQAIPVSVFNRSSDEALPLPSPDSAPTIGVSSPTLSVDPDEVPSPMEMTPPSERKSRKKGKSPMKKASADGSWGSGKKKGTSSPGPLEMVQYNAHYLPPPYEIPGTGIVVTKDFYWNNAKDVFLSLKPLMMKREVQLQGKMGTPLDKCAKHFQQAVHSLNMSYSLTRDCMALERINRHLSHQLGYAEKFVEGCKKRFRKQLIRLSRLNTNKTVKIKAMAEEKNELVIKRDQLRTEHAAEMEFKQIAENRCIQLSAELKDTLEKLRASEARALAAEAEVARLKTDAKPAVKRGVERFIASSAFTTYVGKQVAGFFTDFVKRYSDRAPELPALLESYKVDKSLDKEWFPEPHS